jgi:diguanylate cyclase (GGDEF)-like protein
LDHFKLVNDSYGHLVGDSTLQIVSEKIREVSRSSDVCFRWGGEEFLLLLPGTSEENARIHAEKLRMDLSSSPLEIEDISFTITFSYGISSIKGEKEDITQILNRADLALYRAKNDGRNRGYIYK